MACVEIRSSLLQEHVAAQVEGFVILGLQLLVELRLPLLQRAHGVVDFVHVNLRCSLEVLPDPRFLEPVADRCLALAVSAVVTLGCLGFLRDRRHCRNERPTRLTNKNENNFEASTATYEWPKEY